MNNVDRIFSETLEGYASAPPAGAWERVEMTLSRRPAASPWRWAAVLVPLVIAGGWMLARTESTQVQVASEKPAPSPSQAQVATLKEVRPSSQTVVTRRKAAQPVNVVAQPIVEAIAANPESTPMEEITIEPVELITEAAEPTTAPAVEKPLVIVITLDAVGQVPDTDKKPLTRIAEFALAVKHSDPIGSLRGAKDELLALDLRKKPTKKN